MPSEESSLGLATLRILAKLATANEVPGGELRVACNFHASLWHVVGPAAAAPAGPSGNGSVALLRSAANQCRGAKG